MKLSFSTVVEYVKDLLPTFTVPVSDNPKLDAAVLRSVVLRDVFYINANNGKSYLYVFPKNESDFSLIKYILRSNGLNPRKHMSRYYYERTPVLRIPFAETRKNGRPREFTDMLTGQTACASQDQIAARINYLRQKVK